MIRLSVAGDKTGVEIRRHLREAFLKLGNCISIEMTSAEFGHKDQMHMQKCNDMSSMTIFHVDAS